MDMATLQQMMAQRSAQQWMPQGQRQGLGTPQTMLQTAQAGPQMQTMAGAQPQQGQPQPGQGGMFQSLLSQPQFAQGLAAARGQSQQGMPQGQMPQGMPQGTQPQQGTPPVPQQSASPQGNPQMASLLATVQSNPQLSAMLQQYMASQQGLGGANRGGAVTL